WHGLCRRACRHGGLRTARHVHPRESWGPADEQLFKPAGSVGTRGRQLRHPGIPPDPPTDGGVALRELPGPAHRAALASPRSGSRSLGGLLCPCETPTDNIESYHTVESLGGTLAVTRF